MPILTSNLYSSVLTEPAKHGADQLFVVSGYASPAMVYRHFEDIPETAKVQLIIGMASAEGVSRPYHEQFMRLAGVDYQDRFMCWYTINPPPVHSKAYAWFKAKSPKEGFVGSANYSQTAFFGERRELAVPVVARQVKAYFDLILKDSISCLDPRVAQRVRITDPQPWPRSAYRNRRHARVGVAQVPASGSTVRISLLERTGRVPVRSGLNWGQRPGRNLNEAYIHVPADIARQRFFPRRGRHFTLTTDDHQVFDAVIAQAGDKAIETSLDNSLLGLYFRRRLGVRTGRLVTLADLRRYGRTHVDFVLIDNETYLMEFSRR